MWLLHIYKGNKLLEFLFETEQDVKDYIKEFKPVQYGFRYIKKFEKL